MDAISDNVEKQSGQPYGATSLTKLHVLTQDLFQLTTDSSSPILEISCASVDGVMFQQRETII